MINKLRIALLHGSQFQPEVENNHSRVFNVETIKDLVRLLMEKPIDLIITPNGLVSHEKLGKVFSTYSVPYLLVGDKPPKIKQDGFSFSWAEGVEDINPAIVNMMDKIQSLSVARENERCHFTISHLKKFANRVVPTTKDMFVPEIKNYFMKSFKMENCHWVEVKPVSSKLPAILKLRNELEKQKVDQGALIRDLDSCSMEISNTENYQVWKTNRGEFFAMLWISQQDGISQCIILNKIKIKNYNLFLPFLDDLFPFLQRRWDLCVTVGEAQRQVYQDSLTSLYNQRFLSDVLEKKIEENRRYKTPFSVLFIDVDHFKRVNDSLGHVIGSSVLMKLGELLKGQIRNSDYAFRYGGDEFIILLSHTEGDDAVNVAERIRKAVEDQRFEFDGIKVKITVSIGLAFFPLHAQSAEDIVRIADEAMYYGKNKSRNIVYKAS